MTQIQWNPKLRAVAAVLFVALAKAHAQQNGSPAPAGPRIVISIPDRKLALLDADGSVRKLYDVAIGKRSTPSPTGTFAVADRVVNPTWYTPGKVVPPSPENPLGTRWMGLGHKGYGIHGTNAPRSIGRAASHGCFRMRKADIEELFEQVQAGDIVEIRGERDELVARLFGAPEERATALVAMAGRSRTAE